ncbi:vestitone reductase [Ricinus communis]|uniref:Cinnamoyl-CoA reductase, putative n=1 Tax=Ricinus communis TaxID=3988 RepID=B9SK36_RICCO|nr:vestitone reductase [Ricinus communis]EEF36026.1 cinnamoyl-CoA reductase, putative [Ricinus communis]|eukprot:XP_002526355.1 vestitone reductase [Ricinus communis]
MEENKVAVTGGTGYVASWLIMRLLDHGYSVHTTIRPDPEQKRDITFLTSLPGASDKLKIFHADLSDPNSFDDAIKGCIGVFHVATPTPGHYTEEPEEVVTRKAIDGTIGILKVCLNSKTVKRVVYTSSTSAVDFNDKNAQVMDESFWSDVDYIKALNSFASPYWVSKTLAEKKALEFAEEHGLDLVTVIPSFVVGPFICPNLPASVEAALAMIFGKSDLYNLLRNTSMVHVDDLARAHIFLFEHPNAKGRHICSSDRITIEEMSKFLSAKYPQFPIPTVDSLKDIEGFQGPALSSKKLLDYGFKFMYGLDEMFDGAIQCCKEKGHI